MTEQEDVVSMIENRTFDEIHVGDAASLTRTLTQDDISLFAAVSGDINPAHLDEEYARTDVFHGIIAHGMWGVALISTVLGNTLPGPGTIYLGQNIHFRKPVRIGDTITVTVTAKEKRQDKPIIVFDCLCVNALGQPVISGTAEVLAPTERVRRPRPTLPDILIRRHERYRQLMDTCKPYQPISVGVVHPCSVDSLLAAVEATSEGLITPVLIGPEERIRKIAQEAGIELGGIAIEAVPHSHAAAVRGVELARIGRVEALMKGSLHTDELMGAVVSSEGGLRTGRRVSHAYLLDIPEYRSPILLTDAAINISPSLEDKRDIVQNAVDLALTLGFEQPRVAVLSAVETVNPRMVSTLDAAALCKMAERGQITGTAIDGPLAFDNAVSEEAAREKGIRSIVAGRANILVVPDIESGNMLAKQLVHLGGADAAGIVLGARVPIILTSRSDSVRTRLASCAVAVLMAHARRNADKPCPVSDA